MTCPRLRHGLSECDGGRPAHCEAESSSTCAKHTFMFSTCQLFGSRFYLEKREARGPFDSAAWNDRLGAEKTGRALVGSDGRERLSPHWQKRAQLLPAFGSSKHLTMIRSGYSMTQSVIIIIIDYKALICIGGCVMGKIIGIDLGHYQLLRGGYGGRRAESYPE